ncbi:CAP domain-containing protein [Sphingorhabdus pulchriflava]|uniref:CAP domain-containing protein n=1 Tax=Sphingorhabdus pulchriflava TaxID=2292257 RepID=A0A371BFB0_9SPHN|nr:CAP domain-containing protein [Sphingorhabdus pulchriflava]RDV06197.1 CAP domain-containing protein [Sphingorhabdus pulchriflava]
MSGKMNAGLKWPWLVIATIGLTAMPSSARNGDEADVLAEINFLRSNPTAYARELDDLGQRFEGNVLLGEGDWPDFTTYEGPRAVAEASRELRKRRSITTLGHSELLARAAADHVKAQGASGETGHYSNGKGPGQRVKAHGGDIYVGEAIVYNYSSPQNAVQQLVVDDGVPDRGHRKQLLSGEYRYAGVACGRHARWLNMCVIVLARTADGYPIIPPRGE